MSRAPARMLLALGTALAAFAATVVGIAPAQAAPAPAITIWADPTHAAAISSLLPNGFRGHKVNVVTKELAAILAELPTVPVESAPDLVWADATWTGQLADSGAIVRIPVAKELVGRFRPAALDGFEIGAATYGIPVQVSNVALISNVSLVPTAPASFADLSRIALDLVKQKKAKVPFAIPQGEGSDGYAMYPLFSGLGGYFFGQAADGSLDPSNVGIANGTFNKNAPMIDQWNDSRLIRSAITADRARSLFMAGRSPFWIAGPEELSTLLKLGFTYRITSVPPIVSGLKTSPLLRLHGVMVTEYAAAHDLLTPSRRLAREFFGGAKASQALAAASGVIPANRAAVGEMTEKRLQAIDLAGADAVAIPNIPQMVSVWGPYASAWRATTAGALATDARPTFRSAKRAVEAALGVAG